MMRDASCQSTNLHGVIAQKFINLIFQGNKNIELPDQARNGQKLICN
jgi:hypothetical protein